MSEPSVGIFLEAQGKFLLICHALFSILLIGAMTHHVLIAIQYLRGRFQRSALEKLYVKVIFWAYLGSFLLGALIYPNYRYYVRALYFDKYSPWASHLFDIKEHWAALGLPILFVLYLMSLKLEPKETPRSTLFFYVYLSLSLAVIVWFNLISGLLLTSMKGV